MASPTRVLLLVENNPYPRDFRVRREALTLRDAGCKVAVIAPREGRQPWAEDVDGVQVYRFPAPRGGEGLIGYAFEFGYATLAMSVLTVWVSVRDGIDVIHAANPPDTLFAIGAIFRPLGKKYVFDQHDLAPETYLSRFRQPRENLVYKTLRLLEYCSYKTANVVVSTNQSYKQLAMTRGGKREDQVFIVRNGPPLSYLPVAPDPGLASRARFLIGYVGTIGPQDGVDYLLRAMQHMVFSLGRRDFLAVIIGDGDALSAVKALATELKLGEHVLFTGRLPEAEVRKHLSTVHVCVQPDPHSPLNDKSTMNKLMEYMALGKPTVAFDLTETRFSAQDAAVYVPPNDVAEFAVQLVRLFDAPAERERLASIGRRRIAESLAWEYSASELVRAYTKQLGLTPQLTNQPTTVVVS